MVALWAQVQPTLPEPSAWVQYGPIGIVCSILLAGAVAVWIARERDSREHKQEIRDLNAENRATGEKVLTSMLTVTQTLPEVLTVMRDLRAERADRTVIAAELKAINRKLSQRPPRRAS